MTKKRRMVMTGTILFVSLVTMPLWANNVVVKNVSLTDQNSTDDYTHIKFDSTVNTDRGKSTTTTFYPTTSDAYLDGSGSDNYTTVHDASEARNLYLATDVNDVNVGQSKPYAWYTIFRAGLYFDTSSIPDDAVISSATLSFTGLYDYSDIDFDITVVDGSVIEDPMVKADYGDLKDKTTGGGSMNTSEFLIDGTYMDITLNSNGIGWISKTGTTKFGLRSQEDINSSPPGAGIDNEEYVGIYDNQTYPDYLPKLEVTYTSISIVTVTGTSIAPTGTSPGDTEVGMLKLSLVTDGGSATWTNVKVDLTGTAVDGDISSVEVWKDDGDGTWEGTGHDTEIGSGTFSSKTVAIEISPDQTINTSSQDFYIVYDIAGGADPSHTAGAKLLDNTYITVSGSDEVSSTGFPIESGTSTLPVELSTFTARYLSDEQSVSLYWRTESETDNIGWYVYRNSANDFEHAKKLINDLILGYGTTSEPHNYTFEDRIENASPGDEYWYWIESRDLTGKPHTYDPLSVVISPSPPDDDTPSEPKRYGLHQNKPNPLVQGEVKIGFCLHQTANVKLNVYNIRGELVKQLYSGTTAEYEVKWDGRDAHGTLQPTGIYLYQLLVNDRVYETKRMIIMR